MPVILVIFVDIRKKFNHQDIYLDPLYHDLYNY